MNYAYMEVGLQEVPDEISLCIGITGCSLHCANCHSKELWDASYGNELTEEVYKDTLLKYKNKCSCICFMGGEWEEETLIKYLQLARGAGYKAALYTGENWPKEELLQNLDYIKTGPYIEARGGLDSPTTNQGMYKIERGVLTDITKEMQRMDVDGN